MTLSLIFSQATYGQNAAAVGGDPGVDAAGAVRLGVLTWNVEGGKCDAPRQEVLTRVAGELANLKKDFGLDVIALQEVFEYQAEGIRNAVDFRYMHFYPTIKCDDGKLRGNAIVSRYRFEAGTKRHKVFFWQNPDEDEKRNVIGGRIRVEGRVVYLYTTHLSAKEDPNRPRQSKKGYCPSHEDSCESNFWRAQQAGESVDFTDEDRQRDHASPFRAILMGDFNAEHNPTIPFTFSAYKQVTDRFNDAWGIWARNEHIDLDSQQGYTNPAGDPDHPPKKRIDYVFLKENSRINVVRATRLLRTGSASDHYPVLAILSFN